MAVEVRAARPDEMDQFGLVGAYVYAGAFGDGPDNYVSQNNRAEWTLCAFVDGRMAASYSCVPFTMRANGKRGVVGRRHRGRHVARIPPSGTAARDHDAVVRRHARTRSVGGGVVGIAGGDLSALRLCACERTGDAIASTRPTSASPTATRGSARVARMNADAGYEVMKKIYIDFVGDRIGYLHRAKPLWMNSVLSNSAATGPAHIAVAYAADGAATGYVVYHVRNDKTGHPTRAQEIVVKDLVWLNADAYRSLWSWLGAARSRRSHRRGCARRSTIRRRNCSWSRGC